jgi:hypothetical protein
MTLVAEADALSATRRGNPNALNGHLERSTRAQSDISKWLVAARS